VYYQNFKFLFELCANRNVKFHSVSADCGLVSADCGLVSADCGLVSHTAVACFVQSNAVDNTITVGQ
jgi:hypothetical protein